VRENKRIETLNVLWLCGQTADVCTNKDRPGTHGGLNGHREKQACRGKIAKLDPKPPPPVLVIGRRIPPILGQTPELECIPA